MSDNQYAGLRTHAAYRGGVNTVAGYGVGIKITGIKEIMASLEELARDLQKKSEVAVLRAGAKPILRRAKALVPVEKHGSHKGLLKRSLGITVKKGGMVHYTSRVGPRTGFTEELNVRSRKTGKMVAKKKNPVLYGRLVEYGTAKTSAQSFIRAATEGARNEVISAMATGLEKYLTKYAARMARKAAR